MFEARVTELQERLSALENERRMWRARAEAATACLRAVLVEVPLKQFEMGAQLDAIQLRHIFAEIRRIAERADMLEKDAWTKCSALAKEFVAMVEDEGDNLGSDLAEFVDHWRGRFKAALGD